MALCLAFLFITLSSKAQTVDPLTGNLITSTWQGTTPASDYNGYSGGYMPGYISSQKAIVFGYSQGTASQSIGIANALANAGTGIEVKGYNYSWYYYNNDANRGSLTGNISLVSPTGATLESYNYNMPQLGIGNWIQQSGSQLFTNQYQISQAGSLNVSFTGKDDRFWAGYYGPAIKSIDVRLMYGVDPCKTNPAYSPSCAGFDTVLTSNNLVPNPDAYAYGGYSINQSYSINTALASAGSGAMIHGFKWGYVANTNGPYCAIWFLTCFDERYPAVDTSVSITNSAGATLYSANRHYENSYNTTNYSYLFPTSQQMSTLGNFNFTATTNDQQAYIGSMWSRALYTVDPCVANVLSSPTCKGYYDALAKLAPQPVAQTTTQTTTSTGTTTTVETVSVTPTGTYGGTSNTGTTGGTTQTTETQSAPQQTVVASSSTPVTSATQQTTTQSAPAATPAKVGEVSDSGGGSSKTTVSLSSVLSMIGSNQEKTAALEKSVVQAADAQAFSAGEAAKQNAEKVAGDAQSQSASAGGSQSVAIQMGGSQSFSGPMQTGAVALQGNLQSNTVVNAARMEQSIASAAFGQQSTGTSSSSQQSTGTSNSSTQDGMNSGYQFTLQSPKYEAAKTENIYIPTTSQSTQYQSQVARQEFTVAMVTPSVSYNLMPTPRAIQQVQIEMPTLEGIKFGHKGPVDNAMESKPFLPTISTGTQQTETVKKNVQNNELAGGVSIESIAKQPANYAQYFTMIPDVAFYEPKEIYKNQKVIDNARTLRGLQSGSDRLHQEMINQQYKIGN